jgi:hypothetical protein
MVGPINRRVFMKCAYCNLSGELLKAIDSRRRFEMNVPRQDNATANMRREFSSKQLVPDRSAQLIAYFLLASSEANNSDTDQALSQASEPQADLSSNCKAASAFSINRRRTFFSSAADTLASPTT